MAKVDIEIRQEIAELRERLQRLERTVDLLDDEETHWPWEKHLPSWWRFSDKKALRPIVEETFRKMGVPDEPTLTPPELQQRMIEHGVKPEDRVFNSTLDEMRGEKE